MKHEVHLSATGSLAKVADMSYVKQQLPILVQYSVDLLLPCCLLPFFFEL